MKSEQTEQFLAKHEVDYHYDADFDFLKIKNTRATLNNVRGDGVKLDQVNLDILDRALSAGYVLPPIVASMNGRFAELIDGHHRLDRYKARDIVSGPTYLVTDASEYDIQMLRLEANMSLNGKDVQASRTNLAVKAVMDATLTIKKSSIKFGVGQQVIREYLTAGETREALQAIKYPGVKISALSIGVLKELHKIKDRTPALKAAASLVADSRMSEHDVIPLVRKLVRAPDDSAITEITAKERRIWVPKEGRNLPRGILAPISKIKRSLSTFRNVMERPVAFKKAINALKAQERRDLASEINDCVKAMRDAARTIARK